MYSFVFKHWPVLGCESHLNAGQGSLPVYLVPTYVLEDSSVCCRYLGTTDAHQQAVNLVPRTTRSSPHRPFTCTGPMEAMWWCMPVWPTLLQILVPLGTAMPLPFLVYCPRVPTVVDVYVHQYVQVCNLDNLGRYLPDY